SRAAAYVARAASLGLDCHVLVVRRRRRGGPGADVRAPRPGGHCHVTGGEDPRDHFAQDALDRRLDRAAGRRVLCATGLVLGPVATGRAALVRRAAVDAVHKSDRPSPTPPAARQSRAERHLCREPRTGSRGLNVAGGTTAEADCGQELPALTWHVVR